VTEEQVVVPEVAENWVSDDINAGKWKDYTPPPLSQE
jgi:hypothetical protein